MADVKWIKVATNMFETNRKIKQIELMPEGDTILVIWLKLLLLAGNINDGGCVYLTPEIPYTDEMLANEFRRPLPTVRMALTLFEKFGMIEIIDDVLHLSSWEKYQSTDRLAELRAKDRERKRLKKAQANGELPVSTEFPRNVHGNSTDVPRIEEEKEKDKEKDIHSFVHSTHEEEYIEKKVEESGLDGEDADIYRDEIKRGLRLKYMGGTLGQGVVFMSDEQFHDLCNKLSVDELDKYFAIVAECEKNGKRYKKKSHYQAILDMAKHDRRVK
jgi:predicted phage replisome organizer